LVRLVRRHVHPPVLRPGDVVPHAADVFRRYRAGPLQIVRILNVAPEATHRRRMERGAEIGDDAIDVDTNAERHRQCRALAVDSHTVKTSGWTVDSQP